jgi:hypothetical protein
MTRIGALLSGRPTTLLAMHLTGETTSPRSKSYRPNCVDQDANAAWLFFSESIPECHLIHKAFFEIPVAAHTKFKDADVIANAIGCAPLPEILIQNFLIPWLEEGLRYAPAKTAMTEPNRIVSLSFNSASVTKSPLTCVPFVEFKSFSE